MKYRNIIIHRKQGSERECICGSKMVTYKWDWICERQFKYKEPSEIVVPVSVMNKLIKEDKKAKKSANIIYRPYTPPPVTFAELMVVSQK